jgi:GNAT superfamily N-acetyltransferase
MKKFAVRRAEIADTKIIASHRARMFRDMGEVPPEMLGSLRASSEEWLMEKFRSGEYIGWLASESSSPDKVIAGAGVQLRRVAPHPLPRANGEVAIAEGRQAVVINVFTEPEWRRHGLGELLLREIMDWAKAEQIDHLVLHASKDGRRLYERLGFVATNEMRLSPQN